MSFDTNRVIEVTAKGPEGWELGSGYLVDDRVVLTAWHTVNDAEPIHVRALGQTRRLASKVAWSDPGADAALLWTDVPVARCASSPGWKHVVGDDQVSCMAVGFPRADSKDAVRDTEQLFGVIAPHSSEKDRTYEVTIHTRTPIESPGRASPWSGMSGAALFHRQHLVGMLVEEPKDFGAGSLTAIRADFLLRDERFRSLLGPGDHISSPISSFCMRVPGNGLMECGPPFELGLMSKERVLALPDALLNPKRRFVSFTGRQAVLDELVDWCLRGGKQIAVLTGRRGSGKTRLAVELCMKLLPEGWEAGFLRGTTRPAADGEEGSDCLVVLDSADLQTKTAEALLAHVRERETRVLLIARHVAWVDELKGSLDDDQGAMLLADHKMFGPLSAALDAEFQEGLFLSASRAFMRVLDMGGSVPPWRPTRAGELACPQSVSISALLAVLRACDDDAAKRLVTRLLQTEQKRWKTSLEERELDDDVGPQVAAQAVSAMILTKTRDAKRLTGFLELIGGSPAWSNTMIAEVLISPPFEMELLEDALLADALPRKPELVVQLYDAAEDDDERVTLTSTLRRAERKAQVLEPVLERLVADRLESLVKLALTGAGRGVGPIVARALAERPGAPDDAPFDARAAELACLVDTGGGASLSMAEALWRRRMRHLRRQPENEETLGQRASALEALSSLERALGHHERALASVEELIACYTRMPEQDRLLPELAGALARRGGVCVDLIGANGLPAESGASGIEEARADLEKAVQQFERMPQIDARAAVALVRARRDLAFCTFGRGDIEQAVTDLEALVEDCRGRVADGSDKPYVVGGLLADLGVMLACQDKHPEADARLSEAIELLRAALAFKGTDARPTLMRALWTRAATLSWLDAHQQVLSDLTEAVALCRPLFETDPESYLYDLTTLLEQQSESLHLAGRAPEAEEVLDDARRLRHGDAI